MFQGGIKEPAINSKLCKLSDIRLSHKEVTKNGPVMYAVNTNAQLELNLPSILNGHCKKYARIRVFYDPVFSHIRSESDYFLIRKNTVTKTLYSGILSAEGSGILQGNYYLLFSKLWYLVIENLSRTGEIFF